MTERLRARRALTAVAAAAAVLAGGCASGTSGSGRTTTVPSTASSRFDNSAPWPKRVTSSDATTAASPQPPSAGPSAPPIVQDPIPFGDGRKQEMAAYAERHYGINSYQLSNPHVIVEHFTETATFQEAYNTFSPDVPDSELHELPGTCAHFIVDRDGTIYQLVPTSIMCRHTVGLNYTAIGIEHVGMSDQDILSNPAQLKASLALTRWLACKFGIETGNVIGHNESLSSPYHREMVAALQTQTHQDWNKADMDVYRSKLEALGGC